MVGQYPYPPLERDPGNTDAAIGAFHRLYEYARHSGYDALAAFAVYKALQKLEEQSGSSDPPRRTNKPPSLQLPVWVQAGLWFSFESYIRDMKTPGITPAKKTKSFTSAINGLFLAHRRWFLVWDYMQEHDEQPHQASVAVSAPDRLGGQQGIAGQKTMLRAYQKIETILKKANQHAIHDDNGISLQLVEPRDLVPTQKLALLLSPT